jgi:hypothetical protein
MKTRLEKLAGLWIEADAESLREIPLICAEISGLASNRMCSQPIDRALLGRINRLAAKAAERLDACVAIQTRTGSYSVRGGIEVAPQVATDAWEG